LNKPLVTIAIPTFNRASSYLEETLKNALGQTYENIEILVSDNHSTDRTPEVIDSFSDSRLRYIRQEKNIGKRPNMNFLVEHARGDYFLMYHDDDHIEEDFIETCMEAAGYQEDIGLIVTGSGVIDSSGKVLRSKENKAQGLSLDEFILLWFKKGIHMFLCSSLFNTESLRKAGGFKAKYGNYDDVAAEFMCAYDKGRVDVRECKANLREHAESFTSESEIIDWCKSSLELLELAYSLAPSKKNELQKVGLQTSADRVYRYASQADSKLEQMKSYWTVFKAFGYRYLPSTRYLNKLWPMSGYVLHPYKSLSLLKKRLINIRV